MPARTRATAPKAVPAQYTPPGQTLDHRVRIVHDYWCQTLGRYPNGDEIMTIVMVLAAFDAYA